MKCPRCGNEMNTDTHRKVRLNMCYNCGYIEGRNVEAEEKGISNFAHMKKLDLNELAAFMAKGLGLKTLDVALWLSDEAE
ncbi:MAG: hypothetical protein ACOX68_00210 [Candidatus Limivicinus sp.]|jgi:DNA-directed RNA polymerase subunit M/transcription elongation factor TFIIS